MVGVWFVTVVARVRLTILWIRGVCGVVGWVVLLWVAKGCGIWLS